MKRYLVFIIIATLAWALSAQTKVLTDNRAGLAPLKNDTGLANAQASEFDPGSTSFSQSLPPQTDRTMLAQSSSDYPVTPGDYYSLSFISSAGPINQNLVVEADYGISLGNLGRIEAVGLSFIELKRQVERRVLDAYPLSSPQLGILATGVLKVFVTGEVVESGIRYVWGYSRLSSLCGENTTEYSSYRDIEIRSKDGKSRRYDLFRYWRDGDRSQDPFLRPDDIISFKKADRIVQIAGQVRRPGSYQLLKDENLKDLVEVYADGFMDKADREKLYLTRYVGGSSALGQKLILGYADSESVALQASDSINVPALQDLLPVVYFEGAVGVGVDGEDPQAAQRKIYIFYPGEMLSQAVQALRAQFSAVSDLQNAYLLRGTEKKALDFSALLFNKDYSTDLALQANDTFIIPFRQFFVTVAGAVHAPGRYPYIPDRSWEYYIHLAGGIDTTKSTGNILEIKDIHSKKQGRVRSIQPEDSIIVKADSFLYTFDRMSGVLSALISVVGVIIAIIGMQP